MTAPVRPSLTPRPRRLPAPSDAAPTADALTEGAPRARTPLDTALWLGALTAGILVMGASLPACESYQRLRQCDQLITTVNAALTPGDGRALTVAEPARVVQHYLLLEQHLTALALSDNTLVELAAAYRSSAGQAARAAEALRRVNPQNKQLLHQAQRNLNSQRGPAVAVAARVTEYCR